MKTPMTTTNDAPASAQAQFDESSVTTAMIDAAFKVCPLDAAAELGTGAMQRIIAAAIAAQPAPAPSAPNWQEMYAHEARKAMVLQEELSRLSAPAPSGGVVRERLLREAVEAAKVAEVCAILAARYTDKGNNEGSNWKPQVSYRVATAYEGHLKRIADALASLSSDPTPTGAAVAWHCVGSGDGWSEDKIIRHRETAEKYAERPEQWNVRALIYAHPAPATVEIGGEPSLGTQLNNAALTIRKLSALLRRYRDETPLGHQPHMIAAEVDAALATATEGRKG